MLRQIVHARFLIIQVWTTNHRGYGGNSWARILACPQLFNLGGKWKHTRHCTTPLPLISEEWATEDTRFCWCSVALSDVRTASDSRGAGSFYSILLGFQWSKIQAPFHKAQFLVIWVFSYITLTLFLSFHQEHLSRQGLMMHEMQRLTWIILGFERQQL